MYHLRRSSQTQTPSLVPEHSQIRRRMRKIFLAHSRYISKIMVKIYNRIFHFSYFQVYNSVALRTFTMLYHHYPFQNLFVPNRNSVLIKQTIIPPFSPLSAPGSHYYHFCVNELAHFRYLQ